MRNGVTKRPRHPEDSPIERRCFQHRHPMPKWQKEFIMANDMNANPAHPKTSIVTYTHEAMTYEAFCAYVMGIVGRKRIRSAAVLVAPYDAVEYLNSSAGLIVLAHHSTVAGQVDGIHPATIGKSIDNPRNIIEPLRGNHPDAPAYNVHYMTRKSQGSLVLEAFGRMIDGGDDEAPSFQTDGQFRLEIYNTKIGPIVGVFENYERVYVIRPSSEAVEVKEAA